MAIKIRPLQDRVVVRRLEEKESIKGGIIIPDTAKEKPQEGEVVAGKVDYMSPEQSNFQITDKRSDIFSAGVVLAHLLLGHNIFKATTPEESRQRRPEQRGLPLRRLQSLLNPHPPAQQPHQARKELLGRRFHAATLRRTARETSPCPYGESFSRVAPGFSERGVFY